MIRRKLSPTCLVLLVAVMTLLMPPRAVAQTGPNDPDPPIEDGWTGVPYGDLIVTARVVKGCTDAADSCLVRFYLTASPDPDNPFALPDTIRGLTVTVTRPNRDTGSDSATVVIGNLIPCVPSDSDDGPGGCYSTWRIGPGDWLVQDDRELRKSVLLSLTRGVTLSYQRTEFTGSMDSIFQAAVDVYIPADGSPFYPLKKDSLSLAGYTIDVAVSSEQFTDLPPGNNTASIRVVPSVPIRPR